MGLDAIVGSKKKIESPTRLSFQHTSLILYISKMSSYNPFDDEHPLAYWQSIGHSLTDHHEKMVARNAAIKWVILESGWKKTRVEMVEIMGIPLTTLDNVYAL
jgi:hypothetical protein